MNEITLSKMKQMKLHGMHGAFRTAVETGKTDDYTLDQFVSMLTDAEWDDRNNRKIERAIKNARFHYKSTIENVVYDHTRNIVLGASILSTFFPNRGFYVLILITGLVLFVNYIIVFVRFYRLDKHDLEFVGDLHSYVISMILLAIVSGIINALSELIWHADYDFILYSLSAIPIVFLMRFLIREKNDIEKKQSQYSID
jgi:hypothetical protein